MLHSSQYAPYVRRYMDFRDTGLNHMISRTLFSFSIFFLCISTGTADEICSPDYVVFDTQPEPIELEADSINGISMVRVFVPYEHENLKVSGISLHSTIRYEDGTVNFIQSYQNFTVEEDFAVVVIFNDGNARRNGVVYNIIARYGDKLCNPINSLRFKIDGTVIN